MFVGKLHTLAAGLLAAVLLPAHAAADPVPEARVDRYGDALPAGAIARLGTIRYRFAGGGLAFLPDSKTVVSVRASHAISFWDARTGRLVREIDTTPLLLGHQALAFSQDAKRVAVSGSIRNEGKPGWRIVIRVYDLALGKELRTFEREPLDGAYALALSPDGKLLFSLGRKGDLRIEEVATGAERLRQKFPGDVMASLAVSPDGSTLALSSGPNSRKLFVWKWQAAEEPRELKTPRFRGCAVAFSPDGKLLADCSDIDLIVRVWDVAGGRLLHKLELPDHEPYRHYHVAFSPDGKVLAASGGTNERQAVHLWDPGTGEFRRRLDLGSGALAFSPDGKLLAAGARVWDFAAGKDLSANDEAHRGAVERIVTGWDNLVVTTGDDHTIRIWDGTTGRHRRCLVHGGWIRDIALSPDDRRLVSNSLDDSVCLWDVATGRKIYRLAGHGRMGGRRAVTFSPDGRSFLAWGDDMYLRKWDVRTGKAILEHPIRPSGIKVPGEDDEPFGRGMFFLGQGCFTPDGKHLALEVGGTLFLFDTATGKELRKWPTEGGLLIGLAVSPDSRLLLASAWSRPVQTKLHISAARNHTVTWWDLATGKRRGQVVLPQGGIGPVAFAADGRSFAVASEEAPACIRVVEVASGRDRKRIEGFRGAVRSLAFLPDGRRLVSGMEDGTALVWDLTQ
jgi:WD40 repeat protein